MKCQRQNAIAQNPDVQTVVYYDVYWKEPKGMFPPNQHRVTNVCCCRDGNEWHKSWRLLLWWKHGD